MYLIRFQLQRKWWLPQLTFYEMYGSFFKQLYLSKVKSKKKPFNWRWVRGGSTVKAWTEIWDLRAKSWELRVESWELRAKSYKRELRAESWEPSRFSPTIYWLFSFQPSYPAQTFLSNFYQVKMWLYLTNKFFYFLFFIFLFKVGVIGLNVSIILKIDRFNTKHIL